MENNEVYELDDAVVSRMVSDAFNVIQESISVDLENGNITEDDIELGFKNVFQTRLTKDTVNERLRENRNMWKKNETFIDNNIDIVLNRLNEFYGE